MSMKVMDSITLVARMRKLLSVQVSQRFILTERQGEIMSELVTLHNLHVVHSITTTCPKIIENQAVVRDLMFNASIQNIREKATCRHAIN